MRGLVVSRGAILAVIAITSLALASCTRAASDDDGSSPAESNIATTDGGVVESKEPRRLQACDAASPTEGSTEAPSIDCGGASCNTCCADASGKLGCDPACSSGSGTIVIDCLRDSDCKGGLKCCAPSTKRGGGVFRVDDNRITCKEGCGGENHHVCDLADPSACTGCSGRPDCRWGVCGAGSNALRLLCP